MLSRPFHRDPRFLRFPSAGHEIYLSFRVETMIMGSSPWKRKNMRSNVVAPKT